jgi:hydroxymethylbilane synthase
VDVLTARPAVAALLAPINDPETFACVMAERAFLEALGGNCHSPVAAHARIENGAVLLRGQILNETGSESHSGESGDATALASALLGKSSPELAALFAP